MTPGLLTTALLGRWDWSTIVDAMSGEDGLTQLDPNERDESTPLPVTPLERLEEKVKHLGCSIEDFRDLEKWPRKQKYPKEYGYPRNKKRGHPYGRRKWDTTTALCLHIPGVQGMHRKRWLGVPVHGAISEGFESDEYQPRMVLCHDMLRLLAHSHSANRFSVGLEIGGVTDTHIEIAKAYALYYKECREANLGPDVNTYVMSHRNSHKSRTRDPGEYLWQHVGECLIEEHGFLPGPVVGSGKPHPFPAARPGKYWRN